MSQHEHPPPCGLHCTDEPAEQRHTVDTINSDQLDALQDQLGAARYELATLRETHDRLWSEFGKERARAEQAEAAIARVLAAHLCDDCRINVLAALDEPKEPTT